MSAIRVLVADDHAVFRDGLSSLLAAVPGIEVVGKAADADAAVALTAELTPDVVLMDLRMPGDGLTAIAAIDTAATAVVVLTMHADHELVRRALRAGARGYVLKDSGAGEIVRAAQAAAAGQAIFDAGVTAVVLAGASEATAFAGLTEREIDVLAGICRRQSTDAIARRLGLSEKTVRNYLSNVYVKLGARDRAHAVSIARDAGFTA